MSAIQNIPRRRLGDGTVRPSWVDHLRVLIGTLLQRVDDVDDGFGRVVDLSVEVFDVCFRVDVGLVAEDGQGDVGIDW